LLGLELVHELLRLTFATPHDLTVEFAGGSFSVDDIDEAVGAVERVGALDRHACREVARRAFSAGRMAKDYERLYQALVAKAASAVTSAA
jgi:glycosyltransferase involved in cell wall biosynthesis